MKNVKIKNTGKILTSAEKHYGFTLAEVMVAITVVGLLAAILVPVLISQKPDNLNATLKTKALSTLSEVVSTMVSDKDYYDITQDEAAGLDNNSYNVDIGFSTKATSPKVFCDNFVKLSNTIKDSCTGAYSLASVERNDKEANIVTPDGMQWFISNDSKGFTAAACLCKGAGTFSQSCCSEGVELYVDVNGNEKPNKYKDDIFWFLVTNDGRVVDKTEEK